VNQDVTLVCACTYARMGRRECYGANRSNQDNGRPINRIQTARRLHLQPFRWYVCASNITRRSIRPATGKVEKDGAEERKDKTRYQRNGLGSAKVTVANNGDACPLTLEPAETNYATYRSHVRPSKNRLGNPCDPYVPSARVDVDESRDEVGRRGNAASRARV